MSRRLIFWVVGVLAVCAVAVGALWLVAPLVALQNQPDSEQVFSFAIDLPPAQQKRFVVFGNEDSERLGLESHRWALAPAGRYDGVVVKTARRYSDTSDDPFEYCFDEPVVLEDGESASVLLNPGDCVDSDRPALYPLGRVED